MVRPLLDDQDDLFKPKDLETRVAMLGECIKHSSLPPTPQVEDLDRVVCDYLALYFPLSVKDGPVEPVERTSRDFICTFNNGTESRCLACGCCVPKKDAANWIVYHINHAHRKRPCPRATKWLREELVRIKGMAGDVSKKRRRPPADGRVAIPAGPAYNLLADLMCCHMKAELALSACKSESSEKASEILEQQLVLISDIKLAMHKAMKEDVPLDFDLLLKVKEVYDLHFSLTPHLSTLDSACSTALLDVHRLIFDLIHHCKEASAQSKKSAVRRTLSTVQEICLGNGGFSTYTGGFSTYHGGFISNVIGLHLCCR